jgi:hypothetical protein
LLSSADQAAASLLAVLVAATVCGVLVFRRGVPRRGAYLTVCAAAVLAMAAWVRFGDFQSIYVDADAADASSRHRKKIEHHEPFHFHEFFHYYLGSKYFRELGYLGIYDCATLADSEIATEEHVQPRIGGYVRDLEDVLTDKTYAAAVGHCRDEVRPRLSDARWAAFEHDIRELQRLVPDDWWNSVVYDAGFNPPPSWVVASSTIANLIPIRVGHVPTYLLATSLDLLLIVAGFVALRSAFGATTAALAAVYFGSSFVSSYGWNGGAFLRFTWVVAVVVSLAAMKRERWALAGALLGFATCDRLFPAGFAIGALVPLAYRAVHSPTHRRAAVRFGAGFAGVLALLFVVSSAVFGLSSWAVFFARIIRHGDVYYVMHIGLKKVLTFRDWVPKQNFNGHDGLARFHDWNLRLRATWASMRPVAVPLQLLAALGAGLASLRARPYEAALLCGVVFMFCFNLPANYYYVILTVVPALLLRRAATATTVERRSREFIAVAAFNVFWVCTLVAPHLWGDDIVFDYVISLSLAVFLVIWIAVWLDVQWLRTHWPLARPTPRATAV